MGNAATYSSLPKKVVEADRLAALLGLEILDTPPEREFGIVVETAQRALACKMAVVSLVDKDRQWFKAKCGLSPSETPREHAFCAHAVAANAMLVVPDATRDPRFADNPLVTGEPHIRFYAGVPIHARPRGSKSQPIGTLCVIDDAPRDPTDDEIRTLRDLAMLVEGLLEARSSAIEARRLAEERRQALVSLDRAHRLLRQAERMANVGSWRVPLDTNIAFWSEQTFVIHGLPVGEQPSLEGALDFYPPYARQVVTDALAAMTQHGTPFDIETDFINARGELRRVRSMGELERVDGKPTALVGVFQDVTERYAMEQALRQSANVDDLTRIASRARFGEFLDETMIAAKAAQDPLALFLIDLDHFKTVNDQCGHLAGDELLRLFAAKLQAPYLGDSFAARLGGDEFVLLLSCAETLRDLPALLRRLLADLRHTVTVDGISIDTSATIGASWLESDIDTRSEFLQRADLALYDAKRARRGTAKISGRAGLIHADGGDAATAFKLAS